MDELKKLERTDERAPEELGEYICDELKAALKRQGRGTISRCEKELGHAKGHLYRACKNGTLCLDDLRDYLNCAGIDTATFIREVFPALDGAAEKPLPSYVDPVEAFARWARVVRKRDPYRHLALQLGTLSVAAAAPQKPITAAQQRSLVALVDQRIENPQRAVKRARRLCRRAIRSEHVEFALRTAGELASALCFSRRLDSAQVVLWAAYQQAKRLDHKALVADLLQRMVSVICSRGEYEFGLALITRAVTAFDQLQDTERLGQLWITEGSIYLDLDQFREALEAFHAALRDLPPTARDYRYTAHHESVFAHLGLGSRDEAERCLRAAEEDLSSDPEARGRWLWLRSAFAAHCGDPAAEALYLEAFEALGGVYPPSTIICTLELVHLLLTLGADDTAKLVIAPMRTTELPATAPDEIRQAISELLAPEALTPSRVYDILDEHIGDLSYLVRLQRSEGRAKEQVPSIEGLWAPPSQGA